MSFYTRRLTAIALLCVSSLAPILCLILDAVIAGKLYWFDVLDAVQVPPGRNASPFDSGLV